LLFIKIRENKNTLLPFSLALLRTFPKGCTAPGYFSHPSPVLLKKEYVNTTAMLSKPPLPTPQSSDVGLRAHARRLQNISFFPPSASALKLSQCPCPAGNFPLQRDSYSLRDLWTPLFCVERDPDAIVLIRLASFPTHLHLNDRKRPTVFPALGVRLSPPPICVLR